MHWSMSQADLSDCHQGAPARWGPSGGISLHLHQLLNGTPPEDTSLISGLEQTIWKAMGGHLHAGSSWGEGLLNSSSCSVATAHQPNGPRTP